MNWITGGLSPFVAATGANASASGLSSSFPSAHQAPFVRAPGSANSSGGSSGSNGAGDARTQAQQQQHDELRPGQPANNDSYHFDQPLLSSTATRTAAAHSAGHGRVLASSQNGSDTGGGGSARFAGGSSSHVIHSVQEPPPPAPSCLVPGTNIHASAFPELKAHFRTPEGKYVYHEPAVYMLHSGRLVHLAKWCPVRTSILEARPSSGGNSAKSKKFASPHILPPLERAESRDLVDGSGQDEDVALVDDRPKFKATSEATHSSTASDDGRPAADGATSHGNDNGKGNVERRVSAGDDDYSAGPKFGSNSPQRQRHSAESAAKGFQQSPPARTASVPTLGSNAEGDSATMPPKKKQWSLTNLVKGTVKALTPRSSKPEKPPEGFKSSVRPYPLSEGCIVYNIGRHLYYHEFHGPQTVATFSAPVEHDDFMDCFPTGHDFNRLSESIQLAVCLSSGSVLVKGQAPSKPLYMNKEGIITTTKATFVKWVPGCDTLMVTAYADGRLLVYDMRYPDPSPVPSAGQAPPKDAPAVVVPIYRDDVYPEYVVSTNSAAVNPRSIWTVSKKPITEFAFSPNFRNLAVVSGDGKLRVFDFQTHELLMTGSSYFGGLLTVSWSDDGKLLLTGGEDDQVSLWSFDHRQLLARGEAHKSWVSCVAFDAFTSDKQTYRFGSVGQDTRLLLWEFTMPINLRQQGTTAGHSKNAETSVDAAATKPTSVAVLTPIVSQKIHYEPLCSLVFLRDLVVTSCQGGMTKLWLRPHVVAALSRQAEEEDMVEHPAETVNGGDKGPISG
ncbi:hypothetical protein CAOG_06534 [Capsaspora owczarzaki ATCC 30864]|uniref:hypothetical protein n=1 Tax=Capsaspora owczarzaki (strain ATCC 30864) TaxID=595528 RepID=UPI000352366B|nr:hypothetical protein CAOG_06534 [Capsaspora owczarzaki ATCC 30864]|eukprot:XP_004345283.2 hypothetical protein CAOG_06534 [Capsaspora owczarzaki ATCC 30864]